MLKNRQRWMFREYENNSRFGFHYQIMRTTEQMRTIFLLKFYSSINY
jgi:hypothetical protein